MAVTPQSVLAAIRAAHDEASALAGEPSIAQQIATLVAERDAAVTARLEAEAALAVAIAKLEAAKVEADEVVAEAQDARTKLN